MIEITLRQLEVFVAIAKSRNLTQAAKNVHMTQSAASMSLKEFERVLGGSVFNRIGRGLVINDRGSVLLQWAESTLQNVCELMEIANSRRNESTGKLVIGCSSTIANYFIPGRLKQFQDANPEMKTILRVGNSKTIIELVRSGAVALGLVDGESRDKNLRVERWVRDELVIIAPPNHRLAENGRISPEYLLREQWIMREEGSGALSCLERVLAGKGIRLKRICEIEHTEVVKRSVEAGIGLSWISKTAVERELASGKLVQLNPPITIDSWFKIVTNPGQPKNRMALKLIDYLREMYSDGDLS